MDYEDQKYANYELIELLHKDEHAHNVHVNAATIYEHVEVVQHNETEYDAGNCLRNDDVECNDEE